MEKVTIELNANWAKRVNSPLMWIVWTLQGVSISFAPLFLYWSGTGMFHPDAKWIIVSRCAAIVYLIPLFYMYLGGAVIKELRKQIDSTTSQ